ncbi:MAG: hypothetical protein DUD39_10845 [Coriobacteriaceae bacterium]|nr:MAG: hypothetical protein DUD39_10845 [Coriobacteriaceae bacterium]
MLRMYLLQVMFALKTRELKDAILYCHSWQRFCARRPHV